MKYQQIRHLFFVTAFLLCHVTIDAAALLATKRIFQKHGPLYESVQLLIAEESSRAAKLWNVTMHQIQDHAYMLQDTLDMINYYQGTVNEKFEYIFSTEQTPEFLKCLKQNEREVANFNRELLSKYNICKTSLDNIIDSYQREIAAESNFMNQASQFIDEVAENCHISALKQQKSNQEGIVTCVVAQIGSINQRLESAADLCLNIMLELVMNTESTNDVPGVETESCRSYKELKLQFDQIYVDMHECKELKDNVASTEEEEEEI